ncbi:MAG: Hsp20/alpha crystallin family protein [Anaerolineae bacterium]|nr:Hsp20/alpha crystallin family protein [Anaerolineae bacterium]
MSTLVRWRPFEEVMRQNLAAAARMRGMAARGAYDGGANIYRLPVDVYATDDDIVVTAAVPGLDPENIHINLEDDVLTIEGELAAPTLPENAQYLLRERAGEGRFHRRLRITVPVQLDSIEAVFDNGSLTLTLPKAPEAKPMTIPVKAIKG